MSNSPLMFSKSRLCQFYEKMKIYNIPTEACSAVMEFIQINNVNYFMTFIDIWIKCENVLYDH